MVAVTIVASANGGGRREVLGVAIGTSEAEPFWLDFLRGLARRGLRDVKRIISDGHKGLKAAAGRGSGQLGNAAESISVATRCIVLARPSAASSLHGSAPPTPRRMSLLLTPNGAPSPINFAPRCPGTPH